MRFLLTLVACVSFSLTAGAKPRTVRHVLIVANNAGPSTGLSPLRFADDDGARYFELFSSLGAKTELLTSMDPETQELFPSIVGKTRPATKKRLFSTVARIFDQIEQDRAEGMSVEFFFVFTGHGVMTDGKGGLVLADGVLSREQLLEKVVKASPADFNHVIIDACHAYYAVMSRDWRDDSGSEEQLETFRSFLDKSGAGDFPTTGFILSTAGTAEVHEWERYRGGVFSHELRSGLLGPADVDGDGKVTYKEIEAFLLAANAGVTNPKAKLNVFIEPPSQDLQRPVVNFQEGTIKHFVTFAPDIEGHFIVEDARGMSYAEWNQAPDHKARLALLFGPVSAEPEYFIRRGSKELTVHLDSPGAGQDLIAFDESKLRPLHARSRSSVAESYRRDLFSVPYGRAFYDGFVAAKYAKLESHRSFSPNRRSNIISLGYLLSGALLDSGDVSNGLRLGYRWWASTHAQLAFEMGWHGYEAGREANAHSVNDFSLSVGAGAVFHPWDRWSLCIEALLGNHFVLYRRGKPGVDPDKTKDADDLLAPGAKLLGTARFHILPYLFVQLGLGLSVVMSDIEGKQEFYFMPQLMLETGLTL